MMKKGRGEERRNDWKSQKEKRVEEEREGDGGRGRKGDEESRLE